MVVVVVHVKSRTIEIAGIVANPYSEWMKQVARGLVDPIDGFLRVATHLIHDRDPLFTGAWTNVLSRQRVFNGCI